MGQIVELSQVSPLVNSLAGKQRGDLRLYFPKEILTTAEDTAADRVNENQTTLLAAYYNERNDVTQNIQQRLF